MKKALFWPLVFACFSVLIAALLNTSINEFVRYLILVAPLTFQSVIRGKKASLYDITIMKFMNQKREHITTLLKDKKLVKKTTTAENINIRIFKKKFNRLVLENKEEFNSNMIKGDLSFSISKNEGLCVRAYSSRETLLEIEDAAKPEYNLTERQEALAGGLKFIAAVPVLKDRKDEIDYVICFDSFQQIAQNGNEEEIKKQCIKIAYDIVNVIE